jgi:hypothetical protein
MVYLPDPVASFCYLFLAGKVGLIVYHDYDLQEKKSLSYFPWKHSGTETYGAAF